MTRINVVPVTELCDRHLLSEHRELTRIPNCIDKGRFNMKDQPAEYTLGTGHVKFFYNKLQFLLERYIKLHVECLLRGFKPTFKWPLALQADKPYLRVWHGYKPTEVALLVNRARIADRMPKQAKFTQHLKEM